jgi:hypothetical protein
MMELLRFIFSSFWTWLGCAIFLSSFMHGIYCIVAAARGKKGKA